MRPSRFVAGWGTGAVVLVISSTFGWLAAQEPKKYEPLTVDQARREIRMLDDLYKTAVIYINDNYVEDEGSLAAAEAAHDLFEVMKQKGWHEARLIDATGRPANGENKPQAGFEQDAIKKILAGQPYVDQVVTNNNQSYLLVATLVPAVNQKCILCHPKSKVGDALGAISYRIPVQSPK